MAEIICQHVLYKTRYNRLQRDMKALLVVGSGIAVGGLITFSPVAVGVSFVPLGYAAVFAVRMVRAGRRERELAPHARHARDVLNKASSPR